ncbi:remodeling and spacing factor 1-like isoform X1 [Ptychodera flava]|uniref:remodeling and spacing factor 1-like isoform X1 n=1 Tax=Ptychodera flava TaxID=63121 RepID=UPI00396A742A
MMIPDGEWFCPTCEHGKLITRLQEHLSVLDNLMKRKERKKKQKDRLTFVGINPENIIQMDNEKLTTKISKKGKENIEELILERRSGRQRRQISYRFEEFDDAIDSAIKDEVALREEYEAEYQESGISRGKDMSTIEIAESRASSARKGRKRRLMDLDATSEESYTSEEYQCNSSNYSESEADFMVPDDDDISESDSDRYQRRGSRYASKRRRGRRYQPPTRRSSRNQRRKRYYSDSDEEEEEDYESDHSSDYSDEVLGRRPGRSKRGRVRYQEKSESEELSELDDSEDSEREKTKQLPQELRKSRVVKHRLVSESEDGEEEGSEEDQAESDDDDDDDDDDEVSNNSSLSGDDEPDQQTKRRKRYEEDSDFEIEYGKPKVRKERESERAKKKRVNYREMAGNSDDSEMDSEEDEDDDHDSSKDSKMKLPQNGIQITGKWNNKDGRKEGVC